MKSVFAGAVFLDRFDGWPRELQRMGSGGEVRLTCTFPGSEGSHATVINLQGSPLQDRTSPQVNGCTGHRGVVILVEEGERASPGDEHMEVSRRLASLGKLATRVAHELNNPLDGILRYINLALRIVGDAPESKLKSYLAQSRSGLMRMVQIIGDLLEFSRITEGEFDEVGINEIIEESMRSLAAAADANHVIVTADFQSQNMPTVRGSRLYQICCNLIRNAVDAMPDGGRLSITSGLVEDQVVIRIADTGVGLPTPVERVFEPFFTTKAPGKGTGLGLAICKDFIDDMGGTITAAPGESGGAVFTVRIPVSSCLSPSRLLGRADPATNADQAPKGMVR